MDFYVSDVGDGLALGIKANNDEIIQVDCGSGANVRKSKIAFDKGLKRFDPDYFILSHFHLDHYNGLIEGALNNKNSFNIKELYFPRIPDFDKKEEFLICLFAMNKYLLGDRSGIMEYDLIETIKKLNNSNRKFKIQALSRGDEIFVGNTKIKVLWPPKKFTKNKLLKSVRDALESFENALEKDDRLREIYEDIKKNNNIDDINSKYLNDEEKVVNNYNADNEVERKEQNDNEEKDLNAEEEPIELKGDIYKANKKLRIVANRLSLAFMIDEHFLFMGDLESTEINEVINQLEDKKKLFFPILMTPHHGTHRSQKLFKKLKIKLALSSIGKKLIKGLNARYSDISDFHLFTYLLGDICVSSTKKCFYTKKHNYNLYQPPYTNCTKMKDFCNKN